VTTLMVRFRVADYDAWRPQFDGAMERAQGVVRSYRVWRSQDDRNLVLTAETFDSREAAEALLQSPAIQDEMKAHGVDPASVQIDWLDEVGASSQ
jgi:quinol monooxygenase YgiN